MEFIVCIPARYKSTRLPGKPLMKINGKTIINHVYEKAIQLKKKYNIFDLVILTDNNLIKEVAFKNSIITSFRLKTVVDHIVVLLGENPYFLVENS